MTFVDTGSCSVASNKDLQATYHTQLFTSKTANDTNWHRDKTEDPVNIEFTYQRQQRVGSIMA